MADRIHPRNSATDEENPTPHPHGPPSLPETPGSAASRPMLEKPPPPPEGTYVVQLPKDQVYRVPSPRAAARYENYNLRKHRRCGGCCCRFFCCLFGFIVVLAILIGIAALVFWLVVKPKTPSYSVTNISIKGFNTTQLTTSQTLSPEFDVTVSADNPNTKIGIYYEPKSSVKIYHSNLELSNGSLPVFYQPTQNITTFVVTMTGSVPLTTTLSSTLVAEQSAGKIPLVLDISVPAKLKIGAVKTWVFTVKVNCDIVVNSLTTNSNIVSKSCGVNLNIW
ncbi:NDR1/HIN1-like protein 13 [Macadamia integrifolia]|uniref:NDR1/HIN1-like protein 13 n=1 Tax=Macadamia integrifolia TaxID=60698 RepID=UPI001C500560|nr:NDR1/HIN1-like protein 13 [Macadamia integrifolia]